jgi:hypothetical protein
MILNKQLTGNQKVTLGKMDDALEIMVLLSPNFQKIFPSAKWKKVLFPLVAPNCVHHVCVSFSSVRLPKLEVST